MITESLSATVEGFRLSPQQRRLWTLQQNSTFRAHLALLLEGELRPDVLRAALQMVCARHESLRSTFRRLPGVLMPVQTLSDKLAPSWEVIDLTGVDPHQQTARIEALPAAESHCAFDLEHGPLVHATLYVLSPARHVLSLSLPALCADNRTLDNLFTELSLCYAATIAGDEIETSPLQYLQFAEWQNTLTEEAEAAEGREYWNKQDLTGASFTLPGQRRSVRDTRGETQTIKVLLDQEKTAQAGALAEKYETTTGIVLLAAWQTLLWRLTRQPVVVGHVCSGRPYELLDDAFGLFARALPAPSRFTAGLSFADVIAQTDAFQQEAAEWQDYFNWNESAEYFTFGCEYTELPGARNDSGLQISILRRHSHVERFDLKLSGVRRGQVLELEFGFDNAAFNESDILRVAEQFQTLLASAFASPEGLVDGFEIVSDSERRQIVFDWNRTERDYPLDQCLHQVFEAQVERTPGQLAAVCKDRQLTFQELNQRANQLARYLQAQGVGPEVPVGLCVESSLEMITGVLGILKAGGAYLPLDPRNPDDRLNQVLKDAGVSVLLTQSQFSARQFNPSTRLIQLDHDWEKIAAESVENLPHSVSADNLAYIIYTSGSTGQPKGVMIQHRSAVNLAAGLRDEVYNGLGSALKVGLGAPLAFDASVKQWLQLLSGHTLHLLPEELRLDAVQLISYLDQHALDVLDCTPSQLKLLLAAGFNEREFKRPQMLLLGGEALDESLWSLLAQDQRTRFQNVYGPTECTVDTTWANVNLAAERPTIGRPLPNVQVYILDENLKSAGIYVTGELYVGGSGVGRGYLNRPELTAEKFVPDFLSGKAGARLYRTGDLARFLPDGAIEFLGRNDSQVKIRGHRIELGEIEAVLRRHEQVRQAVVMARKDSGADARLVAYVVSKGNGKLDVNAVRRLASESLPDYMAPSFVVELEELPLTRNGKVDLKSLPAPEAVRPSPAERYVAPRNEIEETITRIWQEALGVEQIGVNDNFFEVGGHSLLMVQVHSKLSEIFGPRLTIVEMFAKPTISALAEHLGNGNGHKPSLQKAHTRAERRKQAATRRNS